MIYRRQTGRWGQVTIIIGQRLPAVDQMAVIEKQTYATEHALVKRPLNKTDRLAFAAHVRNMRRDLRKFITENQQCEE